MHTILFWMLPPEIRMMGCNLATAGLLAVFAVEALMLWVLLYSLGRQGRAKIKTYFNKYDARNAYASMARAMFGVLFCYQANRPVLASLFTIIIVQWWWRLTLYHDKQSRKQAYIPTLVLLGGMMASFFLYRTDGPVELFLILAGAATTVTVPIARSRSNIDPEKSFIAAVISIIGCAAWILVGITNHLPSLALSFLCTIGGFVATTLGTQKQ